MSDSIAQLTAEYLQKITAVIQRDFEAKVQGPSTQGRLFTAKQAGEYINRSEQAVRHLIFQQEIPVVRTGRCVRIDRKDLDIWIERNKC